MAQTLFILVSLLFIALCFFVLVFPARKLPAPFRLLFILLVSKSNSQKRLKLMDWNRQVGKPKWYSQ